MKNRALAGRKIERKIFKRQHMKYVLFQSSGMLTLLQQTKIK
jgi:hypothetical protein